MNIFLYMILAAVIIVGGYYRALYIDKAFNEWNHWCYRYERYCHIHYSYAEKPYCRIKENYLSRGDGILVWCMFWKINRETLFDYKPDWEEIIELYF